jgi:para-nitrobenzyl esterase
MNCIVGMGSLVWLVAAVMSAVAAPAPTVVRTDAGSVQGVASDGVLSFKGVAYAKPPVGALRWRPPQPAAPWRGVRIAEQYGHDCMQKPFPSDAAPLGTSPSEDCLVLNVWRPAEAAGKLPVMVWIYGGGFVNGGSSPAVYAGEQFARRGVVFVSFNYRLGRLGFFAFPALSKEQPRGPLGNYGYMDQLAALKWVQRNIAAFGGDPRNVTVFGESAGGGSVHMLMTSPVARGLFAKAIIESGGGRGNLMGDRRVSEDRPGLPSGETIGVNYAVSRGIEGVGPEALARLRALPASEVGDLDMTSLFRAGGKPTFAGPMQDGRIVVESPEQAYLARRQARVPLIIGANSADIGFNFAKSIDEALDPFGARKAEALAAYDPGRTGSLRLVNAEIGADRMMIEPARFAAATLAAQGLPAYEYRFSYVAQAMRGEWKTGAPHATEIPFVFDTVAAKYGDKLTPDDGRVAETANAYWANFAKTGDPNGPGLPIWPRYDPGSDALLDFASTGIVGAAPDPWKTRLDLTASLAGPRQ